MCWSDEFAKFSFPYKVFYYMTAFTVKRAFYYSPFSATTGSIIGSGLGYNGVKKNEEGKDVHQWDKIIGVFVWKCETLTSPADAFRYWNYQVHVWLKYYVYMRLVTPGKKPGTYESMMTFIISGLWHGFYAFYHVMFFFTALLQELSKDVYRARKLFNFIPPPLRLPISWFLSYLFLDYLGVCVNALSIKNGLTFNRAMHYYIFILIVVGFIVFRFFIVPYVRKIEKKN